MSDHNKAPQKKLMAVTLASILIAQACAVGGAISGLTEERPRHKGGRRRKKTWMEKQQRKRGWIE